MLMMILYASLHARDLEKFPQINNCDKYQMNIILNCYHWIGLDLFVMSFRASVH